MKTFFNKDIVVHKGIKDSLNREYAYGHSKFSRCKYCGKKTKKEKAK